ncbi:MAG TPA: cysteine desulfurase family protein [Fimbriimonas sp.]|nr:cysteine desulfurase family protein [Fimbriimonas sp.]
MNRLYLDYAASAPLLPEVAAAMEPWLACGNPSSLYEEGRRAKAALDQAREIVSGALGCHFAEVVFTSGGTEAANMAIIGVALASEHVSRRRILIAAAEHHSVLHTQAALERLGFTVNFIPVRNDATLEMQSLEAMHASDVLLVCVMHANNELGTLNDISSVAAHCRRYEALLFVDAVQTFGHGLARDLPADLVAVSAHKIGGPKGSGALLVRAGTKLKPILSGGGQERELRGGTENVAAVVGFAEACKAIAPSDSAARDSFEAALVSKGAVRTTNQSSRLSGHCHLRFPGLQAETILIRLDREGVSASSGAACSSGSVEPSHVLLACGYSAQESKEGLRFTFGPNASVAFADEAAQRVLAVINALRK